jgi:hypothetical protein
MNVTHVIPRVERSSGGCLRVGPHVLVDAAGTVYTSVVTLPVALPSKKDYSSASACC